KNRLRGAVEFRFPRFFVRNLSNVSNRRRRQRHASCTTTSSGISFDRGGNGVASDGSLDSFVIVVGALFWGEPKTRCELDHGQCCWNLASKRHCEVTAIIRCAASGTTFRRCAGRGKLVSQQL
uniref:Uncharacterized protein n=1 Tax=Anopheles quadriannulatus TaxID=34691 RepID=A0A182XTD1_ANOQN